MGTNIIDKSLGSILLQSGSGTPTHIATNGYFYSDYDSTVSYQYTLSGWTVVSQCAFGSFEITGNTNTTLDTASWRSLSALTFISGDLLGCTYSGGKLIISSGYSGSYYIDCVLSAKRSAANANYSIGISINSLTPTSDSIGCSTVQTTYATESGLKISTRKNLVSGDTVSIAYNTTANIIPKNVKLILIKI